MKSTDPLFPYQNLFITARPGMGATTLAVNIINKHLDEGKKCLVFAGTHDYSPKYIERVNTMRIRSCIKPRFSAYPLFSLFCIINATILWDIAVIGDILPTTVLTELRI